MWQIVLPAVLAVASGCATVSDKPIVEVKRCEGTSSQRLKQVKAQRYEVEKCKI